MNWKNTFMMGALASMLSSLACIIYASIYSGAFVVDFSSVAGNVQFIMASAFGCLLMAMGYKILGHYRGRNLYGILNVVYGILSFASIVGVLGFNLPLDIEFPEMFPGLVIPMHFFPVLSFLSIYPFFFKPDTIRSAHG